MAAEEGLTLQRSEQSNTGFAGVHVRQGVRKSYTAQMWLDGKGEYLGTFATAEQAALNFQRAKREKLSHLEEEEDAD